MGFELISLPFQVVFEVWILKQALGKVENLIHKYSRVLASGRVMTWLCLLVSCVRQKKSHLSRLSELMLLMYVFVC